MKEIRVIVSCDVNIFDIDNLNETIDRLQDIGALEVYSLTGFQNGFNENSPMCAINTETTWIRFVEFEGGIYKPLTM